MSVGFLSKSYNSPIASLTVTFGFTLKLSKSKVSLVSSTNFSFSNPEGTDKFNNSHDYRFKHKMEKPGGVKATRKIAEAVSKMGTDPYGDADVKKFGQQIDDITSGENFGEVK